MQDTALKYGKVSNSCQQHKDLNIQKLRARSIIAL